MSAKRRTRLLQLAEAYDFLILEDDAYGELGFTDIPPPLKAMDQNQAEAGGFSASLTLRFPQDSEKRVSCREDGESEALFVFFPQA